MFCIYSFVPGIYILWTAYLCVNTNVLSGHFYAFCNPNSLHWLVTFYLQHVIKTVHCPNCSHALQPTLANETAVTTLRPDREQNVLSGVPARWTMYTSVKPAGLMLGHVIMSFVLMSYCFAGQSLDCQLEARGDGAGSGGGGCVCVCADVDLLWWYSVGWVVWQGGQRESGIREKEKKKPCHTERLRKDRLNWQRKAGGKKEIKGKVQRQDES